MKEKPILFNGAMVRAILEGRKTQTRRVIKLKDKSLPTCENIPEGGGSGESYVMDFSKSFPCWDRLECPYGIPGDRIWVRETWNIPPGSEDPRDVAFRADHPEPSSVTWKPSIHMPRDYCRIYLKVTDVRVEQVQDINEDDSRAEGAHCGYETSCVSPCKHGFALLWDSINKERGFGWDVNPWVWVVDFKVIE